MSHRRSDQLGKSFNEESLQCGLIVCSAAREQLFPKCLDLQNRRRVERLCTVRRVTYCLSDDVVGGIRSQ